MPRTIDLLDLLNDAGGFAKFLDGTTHRVLPISGAANQRYLAARHLDQAEQMQAMYDIVACCIPTASREQVDALPYPAVLALLELAMESGAAVGDTVPNGSGPAVATTPA